MSDALSQFAVLHPIASPEELEDLKTRAKADAHEVLFPSFLVRKHDEIVGYVSLNNTPMMHGWLDTKQVMARDSLMIFAQIENLCRMQKLPALTALLPPRSPFYGCIEKLGYVAGTEAKLFLKKL